MEDLILPDESGHQPFHIVRLIQALFSSSLVERLLYCSSSNENLVEEKKKKIERKDHKNITSFL